MSKHKNNETYQPYIRPEETQPELTVMSVILGIGIAALAKFLTDGVKVIPNVICAKIEFLKTEFSAEVYPALLGVGYICRPKIASYMFSGGILGWFVLIPTIVLIGGDTILFPASKSIAELYATGFGDKLDLSSRLFAGPVGGVVLLLLLIVAMLWFGKGSENKNTALK